MKKKVLVWETLSTVSGGQKITLTVMDCLRDQYDFCCLIPEEGRLSEELKLRGIPYVLLGNQSLPTGVKNISSIFKYALMSMRCIFKSLSEIRKYRPDILYSPGPAALPWSAICGALAGIPVVWHLHHVFLDKMTVRLFNICGKWKSVRKIIAISSVVGDQIKPGKASNKVSVIYNPIDVERYRSGDSSRVAGELCSKLGRKETDLRQMLVVGHIALIQRTKKQDFVLRVIKKLKDSGVMAAAIFCGERRDEEYFAELTDLSAELGIERDVLFFGWRDDVPDLLKCMDVLIVPSVEGYSLAGVEAEAAGVPVVGCDAAGVCELVDISGAGLLFSDGDVDDAAEKLIQAADRKDELGKRGMEYTESCGKMKYKISIETAFREAEY